VTVDTHPRNARTENLVERSATQCRRFHYRGVMTVDSGLSPTPSLGAAIS
jgi:hypothetical protein